MLYGFEYFLLTKKFTITKMYLIITNNPVNNEIRIHKLEILEKNITKTVINNERIPERSIAKWVLITLYVLCHFASTEKNKNKDASIVEGTKIAL